MAWIRERLRQIVSEDPDIPIMRAEIQARRDLESAWSKTRKKNF